MEVGCMKQIMKGWPLLGMKSVAGRGGRQKIRAKQVKDLGGLDVRRIPYLYTKVPVLRQEQCCREWWKIWS